MSLLAQYLALQTSLISNGSEHRVTASAPWCALRKVRTQWRNSLFLSFLVQIPILPVSHALT